MDNLTVKGLTKSFGTKAVLKDISFSIRENEIFGLIGLNGVGKTTLIKIILNLLRADGGEAYICGKNILEQKARDNLSYLPEKFQPSGNIKGFEFLDIFCGESASDRDRIYGLCDNLALDRNALKDKLSKCSKGMLQKIGLMATVLEQKKLIMLDEPMSGLDPKARIYLKKLLLDYKTSGKSVFFSSHILADIDEICDRIAVLNNGSLCFVGTPEEFKKTNGEESLEKAFLKAIAK